MTPAPQPVTPGDWTDLAGTVGLVIAVIVVAAIATVALTALWREDRDIDAWTDEFIAHPADGAADALAVDDAMRAAAERREEA